MANSPASNSNLVNNSLKDIKDIKDTVAKELPRDLNKDLKEVKETARETVGNLASGARESTSGVTNTLRDATKNIPSADEVADRAREILGNTQEIAGRAYERSADWVQSNRTGLLGGIAIAALAGTVGYFIGRNSASELDRISSAVDRLKS